MPTLTQRLWAAIAAHVVLKPQDPIERYLAEAVDLADCERRLKLVQGFEPVHVVSDRAA